MSEAGRWTDRTGKRNKRQKGERSEKQESKLCLADTLKGHAWRVAANSDDVTAC